LFCDLVTSTAQRVRVGEDAADRIVLDVLGRLRGEIEHRRGVVVKGTGDGLLAAFGGVVDALSAAIAIQEVCVYPVRVGLSVGEVTWRAGDCFGAPVIEASRLCAAAGTGEILLVDLVRVLARGRGGFAFEAFGELALKGLPDPVAVSQLRWEARPVGVAPLPRALRRHPSSEFVGRSQELARLEQHLALATAGARQLVLVRGDPGAGKTRLVCEFARQAHDSAGTTVLLGGADEAIGLPYQPVVEFLGQLDGEWLRSALSADDRSVLAVLSPSLGAAAPPSDPESDRYRLFSAVVRLLEQVTATGPAIWIVDDLQWSGKPTLDLMRHVLRVAPDLKLLVLATHRTSDPGAGTVLVDFLADVDRLEGVQTLTPAGLTRDEVAQLVGTEHAEAIATRAGGNPFFVTELGRHVADTGDLHQLPGTVMDVVRGRLARLSAEARAALAVGATAGVTFRPDLVGEVVGRPVLDALNEAVTARLLDEDVGAALRYRFAHALVRQAIYEDLGTTRRLQLHADVAAALEKLYPDPEPVLPDLAAHWSAAAPLGHHVTAIVWCRRAADRASEGLGFDEAGQHLTIALDLAERAAPEMVGALLVDLARALDGAGEVVKAIDAAARAGEEARRQGNVELLVEAALALSGSDSMWALNRDRRVRKLVADGIAATVAGTLPHARLTAKLAALEAFSLPIQQRRALLTPAEVVALSAPNGPDVREFLIDAIWASDPIWPDPCVARLADALVARCEAHHLRPLAHVGTVRNVVALMNADGAAFRRQTAINLALAEKTGHRVNMASGKQVAANVPLLDGDFERAEELRQEALAVGRDASPDMIVGNHAFTTTTAGWLLGDLEPSERLIEPLRRGIGGPNVGAVAAWIDAAHGRTADARRFFEALTPRSEAFFSATFIAASGLTALTMAAYHLRDEACLRIAQRLWAPRHEPIFANPLSIQAASSYYKGLIAHGLDEAGAARQLLTTSIDVHRRLDSPPFIAASQAALANVTNDRQLAATALETARAIGAWGIARQANAIADHE
jgi:hypothetical protein